MAFDFDELCCRLIHPRTQCSSLFYLRILCQDLPGSRDNTNSIWVSVARYPISKAVQSHQAFASTRSRFTTSITSPANTMLQGGSFFNGQYKRISAEPSGEPHKDWIKSIPNEGLVYYTSLLNQERLFLTSPQALSEVLTIKVTCPMNCLV